MPEHLVFHVVLLGQILLLSLFLPWRIVRRMKHVLETYPPASHPKLYPKPFEHYEKARRNYWVTNLVMVLAGVAVLAVLMGTPRSGSWDQAIATWLFLAQMAPVLLLDLSALKEYRLMRESRARTQRKAVLKPRRLRDFVSLTSLAIGGGTYVAFVVLIVYIRQFDFPWFGGYWNIAGVTGLNLFLASIVFWHMYGKKLNPHQSDEDRRRQIEVAARVMLFTSIAATVSIALSVVLAALDLRSFEPVARSLYFQLLAAICLQVYYRSDLTRNFEVYKNEPSGSPV